MARTPSNMIPLNTDAFHFKLLDTVSNKFFTLEQLKGKEATVIFFICNHCPFVLHINSELVKIANSYAPKSVSFIGISSNDAKTYPQDGPKAMAIHAKENKYPFVYLYDETQAVAKAYNAACTPDIYVFNQDLKLTYRGQLDDSRPGNGIAVSGSDLRHALNCLLEKRENTKPQKPSIGCNIKWKL